MPVSEQKLNGQSLLIAYNSEYTSVAGGTGRFELSRHVRSEARGYRLGYGLFYNVGNELFCFFADRKSYSILHQLKLWYQKYSSTEEDISSLQKVYFCLAFDEGIYFCEIVEGQANPGSEEVLVGQLAYDKLTDLCNAGEYVVFEEGGSPVLLSDLPEIVSDNVSVYKSGVDFFEKANQYIWLPRLFLKERLYHPVFAIVFLGVIFSLGVPSYVYYNYYENIKKERALAAKQKEDKEKLEQVQGVVTGRVSSGVRADFSAGILLANCLERMNRFEEELKDYGLGVVRFDIVENRELLIGEVVFPVGSDDYREVVNFIDFWGRDNGYKFILTEKLWQLELNNLLGELNGFVHKNKAGISLSNARIFVGGLNKYTTIGSVFNHERGEPVDKVEINIKYLKSKLFDFVNEIKDRPFGLSRVSCGYKQRMFEYCRINLISYSDR